MSVGLEGRRVLVVGASAGIGRAIAGQFVARGAQVAFCARRPDILRAAVAEAGGGAVVAGDVRVAEDCDRVVTDAVAALGGLDAVCYSAAVSPLRLLADTTADDWRAVLETNVVGAALVTAPRSRTSRRTASSRSCRPRVQGGRGTGSSRTRRASTRWRR